MFQNQASHSTRLNETEKCYFPNLTSKRLRRVIKALYSKQAGEKNIPVHFDVCRAFLTLGFVIFSIHKGRRTKNESARKSNI